MSSLQPGAALAGWGDTDSTPLVAAASCDLLACLPVAVSAWALTGFHVCIGGEAYTLQLRDDQKPARMAPILLTSVCGFSLWGWEGRVGEVG